MSTTAAPKLLLSVREAAAALGVSEKTLWTWTAPRGDLPVVRIGTSVRYSPAALEGWINKRLQMAAS